ncbi:unnamed protein product [Camellia sinensis]
MQSKMEDKEKTDILLLENLSEFREELANCSKFAELLSAGIDILVNDAFSQSHRIHASTVAITRFCYACVAGFHFEEGLYQIGGGKLLEKAVALHFLAARCDGLVFVGMMAFQIMHAQGLPVPKKLVEHGAIKEALNLTQFAKFRIIVHQMAALFRIGKGEPPPIPNSLSSDAQDFIFRCLKVNPNYRPTAAELLNHPFVKRPLSTFLSPASPYYNGTR